MASIPSIIFLLLSLSHLHFTLPTTQNHHITDRKSLEIGIGGGDDGYPPLSPSPEPEPEPADCPPPPPPPCPPPLPPPPCPPPLPPPPCPPPPSPPPPPPHPPPPPPPSPLPRPHSPPPPRHSPPPPPLPPLLSFENELLERAYYVLQDFKNLVTDDPKKKLASWNGNDVCKYEGIVCAMYPPKKKRAVASIQINEFHLGGKNLRVDSLLRKGQLDEVTIFHANSNNFIGSVPNIGHLSYLFELDLSNNKLYGDFPTEVLKAVNLTFLDLRFNGLSGVVPPQVFNLDLDVLFINNNNFFQRLPDNIGSMNSLYLTFANNRFTGPIPASIGNIKNLEEVLFLNNQLTGCLPYQIGNLRKATVFDVGFNKLTGPIPYSFGCLDKIEQLNLAGNHFYGTVPEIVCEIAGLKNLSLSDNYFTQVGPKCRNLLKTHTLDVGMNCILDLPNQRRADECAKFFKKKQNCPYSNTFFLVPCGKDPNRVKPDQERLEEEKVKVSHPVSYNALNPDRIRNL
ncbi:hypothetical protein V5N11_030026 [Cardamine amara subsp. amara]|uniref:Cell wall hydroxyproline-rich glycoprotein n=1 Tax=Cardamine amara subsp. amara TaxID=228776 RepID=A0ABD0ZFZ3_CARAN